MARRYGAAIHLIHAVPPLPALCFDVGSACSEAFDPEPAAEETHARLVAFAAEQFPHIETSCDLLDSEPAQAILTYARQNSCDLIAMPTHGYGSFRRALMGSVTSEVLRDSPLPVWTDAHCCDPSHRAHPQPRTVVAAVQGAEEAERAIAAADGIARDAGATVQILRVKEVARTSAAARECGGVMVEDSSDSVEAVVRRVALSRRADLVVIAREERGHILDRFRSHLYAVICESPCPVLTV